MRISGVTRSITVAGISVFSALPPHSSFAPLASASSISALQCSTVLMPMTETTAYTRLAAGLMRALDEAGREALMAATSGSEAVALLTRGMNGAPRKT